LQLPGRSGLVVTPLQSVGANIVRPYVQAILNALFLVFMLDVIIHILHQTQNKVISYLSWSSSLKSSPLKTATEATVAPSYRFITLAPCVARPIRGI